MLLEQILSGGMFLQRKVQRFAQYVLFGYALVGCGDPQRINTPEPTEDVQEDNIGDEQPEQELLESYHIAFVVSDRTSSELVMADKDGAELQRFPLPENVSTYSSPCWSVDGTKLFVFVSGDGEGFHLMDATTGSLELLVRTSGWSYVDVQGSSQGDFAFQANEVGEEPRPSEIAVLHGSELEHVTHNRMEDYSPAWAPDGGLGYVTSTGNSFQPRSIISLLKDGHHTEIPMGVSYVAQILWSPDGQGLAFLGGELTTLGLYYRSLSNSEPERWADFAAREMQWAPSGRYLMLDGERMSLSRHLYRFDVADRQLVRMANTNDYSPAISADSEQVLFLSDRAGGRNLFKMRWDGMEVQQLTFYEEPLRAYAAEWKGYCR